jgi:hypothetical protein
MKIFPFQVNRIYTLILKSKLVKFIDKSDEINSAAKKLIRIPSKKKGQVFWGNSDEKRTIYGIIKSGIYDKIYDIADIQDKKYSLTTKKSNAVMKPFFYFLKIPRNHNKALLILERVENDGLYGVFSSIITSCLRDTFLSGKYAIKKEAVITRDYLEELEKGVYKSISMSVESLPKDIADKYFSKELETEDFSIELTVKFKNARLNQRKIKHIVDSKNLIVSKDVSEIFANSQDKLISTVGSSAKTRTYHLNEENKKMIRPYYEIDVRENNENFSDFSSIIAEVQKFIDENEEFKIFE